MSEITKETFKGYDTDSKLNTLFDYQNNILERLEIHPKDCSERFKKLEKAKVKNAVLSAGGGVLGGFLAIIAKFKIWG
jgi:DNA-binding Lrp family transcriptional regulator